MYRCVLIYDSNWFKSGSNRFEHSHLHQVGVGAFNLS